MRPISYPVILFCIICIAFFLEGCGGREEQPEKALSESAEFNMEGGQKERAPREEPPKIPQSVASPPLKEAEPAITGINDEIVIENQGYTSDKKGPVRFGHKRHYELYKITCNECHHLYQDGKNIWKEGSPVDKCIACHDPTKDQDNVMKLQSAYHNNCKNCHKEISEETDKAPYKKCSGCH